MRQLPLGVRLRVTSRLSTFQAGENDVLLAELAELAARRGPQGNVAVSVA